MCVSVCLWCMYKIRVLDVCIVWYMCVFNVCVYVCVCGVCTKYVHWMCVSVCLWCMYKIRVLDVCIVGYICVCSVCVSVCVCVCMLGAFASINDPECLCMFVHSNKQLFT